MLPRRRSSDSLVSNIRSKEFSWGKQVGSGILSTVYSYYYNGGESAVVKIIPTRGTQALNNIVREIVSLNTIKAAGSLPAIVNMLYFDGSDFESNDFYMSFEKYDMNLSEFINRTPLSIRKKHFKNLIKDLSIALDFVHQQNIYHLDVKPENILVNGSYTNSLNGSPRDILFCLADFSHSVTSQTEIDNEFIFTPLITPPEYYFPRLVRNESLSYYNEKSDIWCLGLTLCHYIACKSIYEISNICYRKSCIFKVLSSFNVYKTKKLDVGQLIPMLLEDEILKPHLQKLQNCLYFHQAQRTLPYEASLVTVPVLKRVSTLKYDFTTQDKEIRIQVLTTARFFLKDIELSVHNFMFFIYNFDTFVAKTDKTNLHVKGAIIMRILLRTLFTVSTKELNYLMKPNFYCNLSKFKSLYQLGLRIFMLPATLIQAAQQEDFFTVSANKLYLMT